MTYKLAFHILLFSLSIVAPFYGADKAAPAIPIIAGDIESFTIKVGTLEMTNVLARSYVFCWEGGEEAFDCTMEGLLNAENARKAGPGLEEIGLRSTEGKEYVYGKQGKAAFAEAFQKEHPGVGAEVLIFKIITGQRLELRPHGKTNVYRVDLKIAGRGIILWSNVPNQRDSAR